MCFYIFMLDLKIILLLRIYSNIIAKLDMLKWFLNLIHDIYIYYRFLKFQYMRLLYGILFCFFCPFYTGFPTALKFLSNKYYCTEICKYIVVRILLENIINKRVSIPFLDVRFSGTTLFDLLTVFTTTMSAVPVSFNRVSGSRVLPLLA
jgi:hypothetical protein